jgi:outer membrane lipoprotein-sorting protein
MVNTSNLLKATLTDLVTRVNADAKKIQTLNATVEIATSVGGVKKGQVREFQQIKGYILEKDPEMLRVIGLFPIVRNRAFDMVSDGKTFKLYIPITNKWIEGPADEPATPSNNTLENLRPHVFFDSLLLHEIREGEIAVLEQSTEVVQDQTNKKKSWEMPDYVLDVIKQDKAGWRLERKIVFDRLELKPHRQMIYDQQGEVATEAIYEDFTDFSGINFPSVITINRPKEEYSIRLTMEKLQINTPINDDQFVLNPPAGVQVKVLK